MYIFSLPFKPVYLFQNYIKNKIHVLQSAFVLNNDFLQSEFLIFIRIKFLFLELNFLKGYTNIYF